MNKLSQEIRREKQEEKMARQNHISQLYLFAMHDQGLTLAALGKRMHVSPSTMRYRLNRDPDAWSIGDLKEMCTELDVPMIYAIDAAARCSGIKGGILDE